MRCICILGDIDEYVDLLRRAYRDLHVNMDFSQHGSLKTVYLLYTSGLTFTALQERLHAMLHVSSLTASLSNMNYLVEDEQCARQHTLD